MAEPPAPPPPGQPPAPFSLFSTSLHPSSSHWPDVVASRHQQLAAPQFPPGFGAVAASRAAAVASAREEAAAAASREIAAVLTAAGLDAEGADLALMAAQAAAGAATAAIGRRAASLTADPASLTADLAAEEAFSEEIAAAAATATARAALREEEPPAATTGATLLAAAQAAAARAAQAADAEVAAAREAAAAAMAATAARTAVARALTTPGLGMYQASPPPGAPGSAFSNALTAARTALVARQARVQAAAAALEREREAADALGRQVAEAEHFLGAPASHDAGDVSTGSMAHRVPHNAALWHDPADPAVVQLHYQAGGVQNIKLLVPVVLEPASPSYARWRDLMLLTLRRYALDDHVLTDTSVAVRTPAWLRLDSIVLSWIAGTISLELHDLVRHTTDARQAWLGLAQ
jgi:hypothetical protein